MSYEPRKPRISAQSSSRKIPQLRVNLLGGFEVRCGRALLTDPWLSRPKVRNLLTLLVLSDGRELSADHLAETLWPFATITKAHNSLNTVLYQLRKALSDDTGECPYLSRKQAYCKTIRSLVSCDVLEVRTLSERLRFDEHTDEEAYRLLRRVITLYRGELLPGENELPVIIRMRQDIRASVASSLLAVSRRYKALENYEMAYEFAQEAFRIDPSLDVVTMEPEEVDAGWRFC